MISVEARQPFLAGSVATNDRVWNMIGRDVVSPQTSNIAYHALAKAKVMVAAMAMHWSDERRHRLFAQLDRLHDVSEWEPGDRPVSPQSFETFLRTMIVLKPGRGPNLGLSHQGNLLAVWGTARDRVTLEFLASDRLRWTLTHVTPDGQTVRNAGDGPAFSIRDLLSPYNPTHWFDAP